MYKIFVTSTLKTNNLNISDATDGTEFNTLEYSMKVKCTHITSQPKDSYRAEDLYENHCGMSHLLT